MKLSLILLFLFPFFAIAQQIEAGFESTKVVGNLKDPASFAFAPDGRLFYGERISGKLRIAVWDAGSQSYITEASPFYQFNVPPAVHRSAGLRGFVFDPDFASNGYIYAFYMQDNPRHNRVVRIQADASNPNVALAGEIVLMELPFNASTSSGSHNGGDLVFGTDGKLYFTTGDGWNGGDNVQSLSTYTGKAYRLNKDGSIPTDNPFYGTTTGNFRAIYALGLRNPYAISNLSPTGKIYINDAVGTNKANVIELQAGANYGHDGYGGIGTNTSKWTDMSVSGHKVITGGLWYPNSGYWPAAYKGNYFAAFWGSNSANAPGAITRAISEDNPTKSMFFDDILVGGELKPVMLEYGLDENMYYMMTDYQTGVGEIYRISYVGTNIVTSPSFTPLPGQYDDPITLTLSNADPLSAIYYTTDGSEPDSTKTLYTAAFPVNSSAQIKAIAYEEGKITSQVSLADYVIGPVPNIKPVANAGPDLQVGVNTEVTLNGTDSFDPDGSSVSLQEHWYQIGGAPVSINDADETVANFTPSNTGIYAFKIVVEDIHAAKDSNIVLVTVYPNLDDYLNNLIARWSFEEGQGLVAEDTSPNSNTGSLENAFWSNDTGEESKHAVQFTNQNDRVDVGKMDITGSEMSICFWTKLNSYEQMDARFVSKASGENDVDHFWMLSTLDDTKFRFRLKTNAGGTTTLISNTGVVPLNQWVFLTATYDGTEMRIYKDSTLLTSTPKTGSIATDPSVDVSLGNQPASATGGVRPLDGFLDEVRIYSTALTLPQIKQIYKSGFQELCLDNLNLPEILPELQSYMVSHKITASFSVSSGEALQLKAGTVVNLEAPFTAENGAVFIAEIDGCGE
ncbi:PQQ-dependent sugar dehydrogenase [uncultured Arcticibacterium sp.]|uniref:PQQ-dependent sugar dehydrogenase n=1 Tax=uncultured Arcticibacterium sp. TaxID=2173042 RepID=UPI0030F9A193